MSESSQNTARDKYIDSLRKFADWLEQNPDVATPSSERFLLPLTTNPAVEEFAATHGLDVEVDSNGNTEAVLHFGSIKYVGYGYADFGEFCKQNNEKQARNWADNNGMVIQPRDGGAE
ncbi:hypothetical protein MUK60_07770 [Streptomyces sp. LRE541]|uniref:hypothetical protein n=1 Tax=Streptomyces sp. LRE541 TaxID=2931983 RepID=UPI002010B6E3|nr:hypothetical protein [Streptomyces sp. LRE541]UPZ27732.1 hypothetical protein MUK60_07770 [Streptomyces sp. LRE541]